MIDYSIIVIIKSIVLLKKKKHYVRGSLIVDYDTGFSPLKMASEPHDRKEVKNADVSEMCESEHSEYIGYILY